MRSFILALYATLVSNFVYQALQFFYVNTSVGIESGDELLREVRKLQEKPQIISQHLIWIEAQ